MKQIQETNPRSVAIVVTLGELSPSVGTHCFSLKHLFSILGDVITRLCTQICDIPQGLKAWQSDWRRCSDGIFQRLMPFLDGEVKSIRVFAGYITILLMVKSTFGPNVSWLNQFNQDFFHPALFLGATPRACLRALQEEVELQVGTTENCRDRTNSYST